MATMNGSPLTEKLRREIEMGMEAAEAGHFSKKQVADILDEALGETRLRRPNPNTPKAE